MRDEIRKINRLIDEISSLLMKKGSTEIDIKIKRCDVMCTITIIDYNTTYCIEEIEELSDILNIQRQCEIEGFYWELMGDDDKGDELFLVGSMIDSADVNKIGEDLHIVMKRKYFGKK